MSCNGCRILRKGCSEDCMLRQSLEWIGNPQPQSNATLFVAKFFGRAGLMSFISAVPRSQRPALFQSLLFEAVGRTVNPVSGVVGLLWTGNWGVCQAAVTTVLRRGTVEPIQELDNCNKAGKVGPELDNISESCCNFRAKADHPSLMRKKRKSDDADLAKCEPASLEFGLTRRRDATPSEESETTTFRSEDDLRGCESENKLLRLFLIITYHTDALPSSYTNSCWVSCKDARELNLRDHKYPNMWLTGDESSKAWTEQFITSQSLT